MAANFEVRFIVDRVSGSYKIRITDTSTGFTLAKANTKITFPDGYVIENTDVSNPDISSAGGYIEKNARLDVNNKIKTGGYTINFTGYDASDNEYTSQKQFNFSWQEPTLTIQDLSDGGVPIVKFKDATSWSQGSFTQTATTRTINASYPTTSAQSGQSKSASQTNLSQALELDMAFSSLYYEGIYSLSLNTDILYSHTNGYLTVQFKKNSSQSIPVRRVPTQTQLVNKLNLFKTQIDTYKVGNPPVYAKLSEVYDNAIALYAHSLSRYRLGIGDGAQDSLQELLDLIDDQVPHTYQSGPMSTFIVTEDDVYDASVTKLEQQIGTFDAEGNLTSISLAFAQELFDVDATDFKAEVTRLTTLLAQFGTINPSTGLFEFSSSADYFERVKTYADIDSAAASKVSSLATNFGNFDGNTFTLSTSSMTSIVDSLTLANYASTQSFNTLTSTVNAKAEIFRQDDEPSVTNPVGSIWYDTNDNNKVYVLVAGEPNVWTLTSDDRIVTNAQSIATANQNISTLTTNLGAEALLIDELQTQFTFDGANITGTADALASSISTAQSNAESASAGKIETLAANFFSGYNAGDGTYTDVSLSNAIQTEISSVVSGDGYATASDLNTLKVTVQGTDGTGGLVGSVSTNQSTIAARPKVFRQDAIPAITEPVGSLWFDTDDNNKPYILISGTPNVWAETRDEGLVSDIAAKPFIFRQDEPPSTSNPAGSLWYDTNDGNKPYILISSTWTEVRDTTIATAQATADARPKVFRQDDAPVTTNPEFSIWYDTNDNNKTYILLDVAGTLTWTETVDGRVTDLLDFVESKYSLTVDANGVITGLELYSASGANTTQSVIKLTADKFVIRESSTDFVPFTLDGSQLKLDVPLNGVSGTFSGALSAATGTFAGELSAATGTFAGSLRVGTTNTSVSTVVDGAALGATANQDSTATILSGEHTGSVSGNVTGTVDGVAAGTIKTGAAAGTTAKGVTDNLTSVVDITSSDIAIVNSGQTKTYNNSGTPFYVDNAGQFSLGDKLSYDPSTNTLSIAGAVTIESVSGLDKTDVGLDNVDNTSVANILDGSSGAFSGNLTGTVDGTAASTVKAGAADGSSAKTETDKLNSVVTLTNSDIAIVNSGQTKAFYNSGTPFYVDNTGDFSLGNKLKYDNSANLLTISGAVTIESVSGLSKSDVGLANVDNTSVANILDGSSGGFSGDVTGTVDGTAASTVKSGAADGASAKTETDKLNSVVSLTSSDIAIVNSGQTKTFYNSGTPFYVDNTGDFSLGNKLKYDNSLNLLTISGAVTIESVSGLTKSDVGLGNVDNTSVTNILNGTSGAFSGDVTGTIDGAAATTVKTNAADGATAKGETDKLTSVVSLTNSDIAIVNSGTKGYNTAGTPFYVDNTGKFSLGDKLTFSGSALTVNGEITSTSGNIGGWLIDSSSIKSPLVSSVNNLQFYSTASNGLVVRDSQGDTALQIKYGGLTTLSSTTTGITFADVDNVEFGSFSGTVSSGVVSALSPEKLYKTTGTTYLTGSNLAAGSYVYDITVAALPDALVTVTGGSKASIALWVEFATDTSFSNVIKSQRLIHKQQAGAGTITFLATTSEVAISIDSSITALYARFYWERSYAILAGASVTFTSRTFNISSADTNNDLVFIKYKGRTELTNEGFQVINDPATYFKIDRTGYTSIDPYVSIGGKLKVDGDVEITGNVNFSGEIQNSDVTVDNLIDRLGQINANTYLGNSTGVTFTLRDNLIVEGDLTVNGSTVTVNTTNLSVADNLIHVADNNNLNTVDLGIVGHYSNDGGTTANHVGMFWDASATRWKFFDAYTKDELGTSTVDTAHVSFSLGDVEAATFIGALSGNASSATTANNADTVDSKHAADFNLQYVTTNGASTTNSITAASFVKSGGTGSQFLKADGTVDSNTYITSFSETDTLATVTTRGATTTNAITVGGLTVDTDTLYVDSTNNRVGIGTTSPTTKLHVEGSAVVNGTYRGGSLQVNDYNSNIDGVRVYGYSNNEILSLISRYDQADGGLFFKRGNNGSEATIGEINWVSNQLRLNATVGSLAIQTGNSTAITVDSSQRVGIGTTSPDAKLHVAGGIKSEGPDGGMVMRNWQAGSNYGMIGTANMSSQEYALLTDGTDTLIGGGAGGWTYIRSGNNDSNPQLVINGTNSYFDGGNVGIGTTNPLVKLSLGGGVGQKLNVYESGNTRIGLGADIGSGHYGLSLYTNASMTFGKISTSDGSTFTEFARFNSSGNLGIGTTSPNSRLRVVGSSNTFEFVAKLAKGNYADTGGHTTLIGLGCEDASWSRSAIGHTRTTSYDAGYLGFYVSNNNSTSDELVASDLRMMINRDGNVGIGTTSPSNKLEVNGGITATSFNTGNGQLYQNGFWGTTIQSGSGSYSDFAVLNSATNGIMFNPTGTLNMVFNGNVGIGVVPSANVGNLQIGGSAQSSLFAQQGTDTVRAGVRAAGRTGIVFDSTDSTYTNRMWYIDNVGSSGKLIIGRNGLDVATFDNSGNVGIGAVPTRTLQVHENSATSSAIKISNSTTGATINDGFDLVVDSVGNAYLAQKEALPLIFLTSDTERMRIDSSGNVTIRDGKKLILNRPDNAIDSELSTNSAGTLILNSRNGEGFDFQNAGISAMRINSSGNVGIGTTSPGYKLEVQGSMLATSSVRMATSTDASVTVGDYHHSSGSSSDTKLILAGKNLQSGSSYYGDYGQLLFRASSNYTGSARQWLVTNALDAYKFSIIMGDSGQVTPTIGAAGGLSGGSPVITIDNSARVGIGTTSPSTKLHVAGGDIYTDSQVRLNQGQGITWNNGDNYIKGISGYHLQFTTYDGASAQQEVLRLTGGSAASGGGRVGIGTTTPSNKLHVKSGDNEGIFMEGTGGGHWFNFKSGTSNLWSMGAQSGLMGWYNRTSGSYKMVILDGGNVGIGTTSPSEKLHVAGNIAAINSGNTSVIVRSTNTFPLFQLVKDTGTTWNLEGGREGNSFGIYESGYGTRLVVATGGNVGIGTTSPAYTLDVNGNAAFRSTTYMYDSNLYAYNSTAGTYFRFGNDSGVGALTMSGSQNIGIQLNGGNVGIGNTTCQDKLHVTGGVYIENGSGSGVIRGGTNDAYHGMTFRGYPNSQTTTAMTAADVMSFWEYGGDFRWYVKGPSFSMIGRLNNGTLTVSGDVIAYGSPSDISLKENIKPIENALDKVKRLQGVTFDWKKQDDQILDIKEDYGFIAQDVQEVVPELVRMNDNGKLSLRDKGIVSILVEAIKEQQKQIDELKSIINN